MIGLRDYQVRAIDGLRNALHGGVRSAVLVSPTGSGKTVMGAAIVARAAAAGRRVLWVGHRRELIDQAADAILRAGVPIVGVQAASSQRRPSPHALVQVAAIQTLQARESAPPADVVIVDEAHHYASDTYAEFLRGYAGAHVVGLTATPERSDGRGLGHMFRSLVVAATIRELTERGQLVPLEIVRPAQQLRPGQIAQRPVDAYRAHAQGRPTLVFSPSVAMAEQHAEEFRAAGIEAVVVEQSTPAADRSRALARFAAGHLPVIVNVMTLTEGADLPITGCVILARGCGTPGLLIQMAGRALRPAPGKTSAVLVDLRGVTYTHGDPTEDRAYSLEGRGIRRPGVEGDDQGYCQTCGAPKEPGAGCEECGAVTVAKPLKVTGDPLVKFAKMRALPDEEKRARIEKWKAEARAKGYRIGWVWAKARAVFGDSWKGAA